MSRNQSQQELVDSMEKAADALQSATETMRALLQTLTTEETPKSTASPSKKVKSLSKKEGIPEPVVEQASEEVAPEPTPLQEEVAPEPVVVEIPPVKAITFEQLRGAMAGKSQQGKKAEVKALLTKYGAEKLSDLPMEAYSKVMAEVEALE